MCISHPFPGELSRRQGQRAAAKLLECCVDSVESAEIAAQAGADRLELCANLVIGGTSPGIALLEEVKRRVSIPVRVLLRPRFGDFLYSEGEFAVLLREAELCRAAGADGLVLGCLTPQGNLDCPRMERLIKAGGLPVTLHRAFDVCADPFRTLKEAEDLGIDTILTSGGQNSAAEGKELLCRLAEAAQKAVILAGAGVNAGLIQDFLGTTPIRAFHMSGKTVLPSGMQWRNPQVSMGLPAFSEYELWRTSGQAVAAARQALDQG